MALGSISGRARVDRRNPRAQAVCDRCGFRFQLDALRRQMQWAGNALVDTGFLVCRGCLDVPQDQNRALILPPDPIPRVNPRPDYDVTPPAPGLTPDNQGFTQYLLGGAIPGLYPTTKAEVLSQVAQLSGVATPPTFDRSIVTTPANTSIALLSPQAARTWLLLYNPSNAPVQVNKSSTAVWGTITNLILGPGEAYFWATDQGFTATYTGAMAAVGLAPAQEFWCWEFYPASAPYLVTEDGVIITTEGGDPIII